MPGVFAIYGSLTFLSGPDLPGRLSPTIDLLLPSDKILVIKRRRLLISKIERNPNINVFWSFRKSVVFVLLTF